MRKIKYIITRILIGTGVVLLTGFIRSYVNADSLPEFKLKSIGRYVDGEPWGGTSAADFIHFSSGNQSYTGGEVSSTTARNWPYNRYEYRFDVDNLSVESKFDFSISVFVQYSDQESVILQANDVFCNHTGRIGNFNSFNCQNVTLKSNNNTIEVFFNNNGDIGQKCTYGITIPTLELTDSEQIKNDMGNINNSINDSSIDTGSSNSFFDKFQNEDNGGLSSIVKKPLELIQKFTNGQCTPVKLPLAGKEFDLPCGSFFWERGGVSEFKVVYNIIIGGIICYGLATDLYKTIKGMKDPQNDKVEVLDL